MPEYTPELRAKVDAAMTLATIIAPEICDIGDYDDFDGTGIVILDDDMRIAAFHKHKDAAAYVAAVNAIAPYTAHIDAQAERIAELERDNARLREGLDKLALELREYSEQWKDEGVASVIASRVARALGNYASDVSTNKYALKDTAQ